MSYFDAAVFSAAAQEAIGQYTFSIKREVEAICSKVKSPIEARMATWLVAHCSVIPAELIPEHNDWSHGLEAQVKVGAYCADLMLTSSKNSGRRKLVVECDGHEFHERTRAQAAHDKQRDRYFVAEGLRVMRFTGSEIFRDPLGCVDEIMAVLEEVRR